jgi:hypothetical protein
MGSSMMCAVARLRAVTVCAGAGMVLAAAADAQQTPAAPTGLRIHPDGTPPVLSLVMVSAITASGATIIWTTDQVSDSQVDYGPSAAYGSSSALTASLVTAHAVAVGGLAAGTQYHSRVRSKNAAGDLAVSADFTFTTLGVPGAIPAWPNEPAGLTVRTDWGFDQPPPILGDVAIPGSPGWKIVSQAVPGSPRGWTMLVLDPGAPLSPLNVYDFVYPQGMVEGNAPATVYYSNLGANEVYAGFWWKPSSPFDLGPDGNKIAFLFNGAGPGGGQQFLILRTDGRLHVLPEYPGDFRWRAPNVTATVVTLGAWHRIEWYANVATGTLEWWLDGVLQGSHTDVRNPVKFDMFQLSPTWGGNIGALKHETDHYWFDHVHLSTR